MMNKKIPQDFHGLFIQYTMIIKNPHSIKTEKREVGIMYSKPTQIANARCSVTDANIAPSMVADILLNFIQLEVVRYFLLAGIISK